MRVRIFELFLMVFKWFKVLILVGLMGVLLGVYMNMVKCEMWDVFGVNYGISRELACFKGFMGQVVWN